MLSNLEKPKNDVVSHQKPLISHEMSEDTDLHTKINKLYFSFVMVSEAYSNVLHIRRVRYKDIAI